MGRYGQLALMLTKTDDGTLREVVTRMEKQREADVERRWEFVNRVISADDSGLLADRIKGILGGVNLFHNPLVSDQPPALPNVPSRRLLDDDIDPRLIQSFPDEGEEEGTIQS
jgi:hypothetical protein